MVNWPMNFGLINGQANKTDIELEKLYKEKYTTILHCVWLPVLHCLLWMYKYRPVSFPWQPYVTTVNNRSHLLEIDFSEYENHLFIIEFIYGKSIKWTFYSDSYMPSNVFSNALVNSRIT